MTSEQKLAEDVLESLTARCRHGVGSYPWCAIHNVAPVRSEHAAGRTARWKCPVSGDEMETRRQRRRWRRKNVRRQADAI